LPNIYLDIQVRLWEVFGSKKKPGVEPGFLTHREAIEGRA